MLFHGHVFTVFNTNLSLSLGTYPTFREAYERIEDVHSNDKDVIAIVDLGDNGSSAMFEVIRSYKYNCLNHPRCCLYKAREYMVHPP